MEELDDTLIPLFPYKYKFLGYGLMVLGVITGYLYFFGGRPAFFETKVFAIVTAYIKTRYFVVIQTNLLDEMAAIFLLSGLGFISFSKEKMEKKEFMILRFRALIWAAYSSIILWILVFLLFYGYSIFILAPLVFIFFFVFYNIIYRVLLVKH